MAYDISGDDLSCYSAGAWNDDLDESLGTFNDFTDIKICIGDDSIAPTHTEEIYLDYFYYIDGEFKATPPSL
jgi:hypothetical protein